MRYFLERANLANSPVFILQTFRRFCANLYLNLSSIAFGNDFLVDNRGLPDYFKNQKCGQKCIKNIQMKNGSICILPTKTTKICRENFGLNHQTNYYFLGRKNPANRHSERELNDIYKVVLSPNKNHKKFSRYHLFKK